MPPPDDVEGQPGGERGGVAHRSGPPAGSPSGSIACEGSDRGAREGIQGVLEHDTGGRMSDPGV